MIAGRPINVGYVIGALKRRALWIILPLVIGLAGAVAVSLKLHNLYRSQTVILVIPQRVPEAYIRSTVTQPIESRLRTIGEQIKSRSRLERIITEFNLYADVLQKTPMEEVVELMKERIEVIQGKGDSFSLAFTYSDPSMAATVTDRLASMYINENLRDREMQSEDTSQFLETELDEARRQLVEHDKKLEAYRRQYSGQLPTQVGSNLQLIQTTQQQIQGLTEVSNRFRDQRVTLQRQISDAEAAPAPMSPVPQAQAQAQGAHDPTAAGGGTATQQLEAARRNLTGLLGRLTPNHPDVKRLEARIAELEAKATAEAALAPSERPAAVTPAEIASQNRLRDLRTQLANVDRQIAFNEGEEARLRQRINEVQARIDALPSRESELANLTRDYGTLQASYQTLLAKKEDSRRATSLERRQRGQQFQVLDAAQPPERPVSPNRPAIIIGGAAAGLVLGLLLGVGVELRDTSLRTQDEVLQLLDLPVLALIPVLVTPQDLRQRRRRRLIAGVSAVAVSVSAGVAWWIFARPGGLG